MRLNNEGQHKVDKERIVTFTQRLLDIGNGYIGTPDEFDPENSSWIDIPDEYRIPDDENGMSNLISFIYDDETLQYPSATKLQDKAIVCPRNDTADAINNKILSMLSGTTHTYISYDEAIPHGHDGGEVELLYPREYLNTLSFAGLPPHRLQLKVGTPIMLLRNLNIVGGLCNGTRLIVTQLLPKVIEAQIITVMATTGKTNNTCKEKDKMIMTEPEITAIADLRPTHCNKTIEAVVYPKWTSRHVYTRQPTKYCP
ncbi:DNA helicase [Tanacetum coccineum]